MIDLAKRAHDRNFSIDPIIRSLIDTDLYKLMMQQFIWKVTKNTPINIKMGMINRTKSIPLADIIDEKEYRAQLDHVRTLKVTNSELIGLAGHTFYGQQHIFEPEFLKWLSELRMPPYTLTQKDNQWSLEFEGPWAEVTLWEIYALAITSELRTRHGLARMNEMDLRITYAGALTKLWHKLESLANVPGFRMSDMGTRRRHSHLWQEQVIQMQAAKLGENFVGTSNAFFAFKHNLEAIGTNAHELQMVFAALSTIGKLPDCDLVQSQYFAPKLWQKMYPKPLWILLPDTYGSKNFWENAPTDLIRNSSGARLDSGDPFEEGDLALSAFKNAGADPKTKLLIPSDGLNAPTMLALHSYFAGDILGDYSPWDFHSAEDFKNSKMWRYNPKCRISMGVGTDITNDFKGCAPIYIPEFEESASLVCKVLEVEGKPAVKLSNNITKATGPKDEVEYYISQFGDTGRTNTPVFS